MTKTARFYERATRMAQGCAPFEIVLGLSQEQADILADFLGLENEDRDDAARLSESIRQFVEAQLDSLKLMNEQRAQYLKEEEEIRRTKNKVMINE